MSSEHNFTTKSIEDYFCDWEENLFGFGYGSGEEPILSALKRFFSLVPTDSYYDHIKLEKELTPEVAWLLINILCRAHHIEYGTSPRTGWLTKSGKNLQLFFKQTPIKNLLLMLRHEEEYFPCTLEYCNCGISDCRPENPFWKNK